MTVETHIGQYKILRTLGAGGMGTVYLGEHILLGRRAAIKTLLPALSSHREIVDRFFNEARAISAISDPGVVQIFDFGYHVDGTAYIVMEFLEGECLSARLDRLAKLPLIEALRLTRQIAASLGAAHARGIVHRDLKPANVFVIRDSEAQAGERTKILDFGIAKLVSSPTDVVATQTGTMLGTPVYMSPEQCRGSGKIDHRSDIYSVGCALFHMLTGVPPFDCDTVGDFIAAHLKEEPPAPSELAQELPPPVDALVLRCLAKKPEDRFQSMAELQAACEDVLAHLSDGGAKPVGAPVRVALSAGFKSGYDVNQGNRLSTVDQTPPPPSSPWFVDSMNPVPAASLDDDGDDHEWVEPERGMSTFQRIALVGALFAGLIGGVFATGRLLGDDDHVSVASPGVPASPDVASPAVAPMQEVAPLEPIARPDEVVSAELDEDAADSSADRGVPAGDSAATTPEAPAPTPAAPVVQTKPDRPRPARTQNAPRSRRVAPAASAAAPAAETQPQDDLYDTR